MLHNILSNMVSLQRRKLTSFAHLLACWSLLLSSSSECAHVREQCTSKNLLVEEKKYLQLLSNFLHPLDSSRFLTDSERSRPTIIDGRSPGFYGGLMNLNVIGDYLMSQSVVQQLAHIDSGTKGSSDDGIIKHGTDWKLVKRIFKSGKWWSSTLNASEVHLQTVYASFEKKGYSIVIDKMQNFHPPLMIVTSMLESLFGCKVNANVYVTPSGGTQAFETHFDWMDSIIVQITGCKVWRVSSVRSAVNPLPDTVFKVSNNIDKFSGNDAMPENSENVDDLFEMSDGALLYLPRGFAHEAATNCSSSTSTKSSDSSSSSSKSSDSSRHHAKPAKDEIIDKTPSIHITFGLETATDSTVEIFLHFYISTCSNSIMTRSLRFLDVIYDTDDIMEGQYLVDVCHNNIYSYESYQLASEDLEHSTCIVTAKHDPTNAHYRSNTGRRTGRNHHEINSMSSTADESQLIEMFFRCLSDGSIMRVRDISLSDLLHLILHVAATATAAATATTAATAPHPYDASEVKESSTFTTRGCNSVNDGATVDCTSPLNSSVLRQAIAVTTFTARNQYKPNLYDILPQSLEYLHDFLSSTSTSHLLQQAVTLGIDMGIFTVTISTPQNPSTTITTTREKTSPEGEELSTSKKLNYIKRFITSSPSLLFNHSRSVQNIGIESKWSISEIREIFNFREWDVSVILGESLIDVEYFVRKSFELLNDSEGSVDGVEGSGESEVSLYCASWIRITDELRQQRVDK